MSKSCQACGVQVTDGPFMKCTKKLCEKVYDLKCLAITQEEFMSFSGKYTQKWVCPECICSKPKPIRYDPDTPIRSTPELNIFTPNPNVNTHRGSRLKMMDEAIVDSDGDSILLAEFRSFKSEVLTRLDAQAKTIKHLQEICFSTKSELEKLSVNMRVFQDKFTRKDVLLNNTQMLGSTDNEPEYLNTDNHKNLPVNFAEVTCTKIINTGKQNTTTRVTKMCEATKTVEANVAITESKSISQPRQIVSSLEFINNNNKNEEEKNNKDNKWITIRKKRRSSITKNVKKGKNTELVEIQAIEKKKHLHVWRLTTDTTIEKLTSHVKIICGSEVNFKIEKIKHKTERDYASFIITVPESIYEKLCQPEVWPINAEFSEWIWFRKSSNRTEK